MAGYTVMDRGDCLMVPAVAAQLLVPPLQAGTLATAPTCCRLLRPSSVAVQWGKLLQKHLRRRKRRDSMTTGSVKSEPTVVRR